VLRSEVEIANVSGEFLEPPPIIAGQTIFENKFVTLYAGVGRRFRVNNLDFDLMTGPEIGFNTASKETGEAETITGVTFTTDRDRSKSGRDFRLRTSLAVYYSKLGFTAGYSYGLTNYSGNLIGANRERYSRYIRFGLIYRIR
jgi:hypothetical protein